VNEYDLARADHPAGDYGYSKFGPGKSYNAETRQELLHKHKRSASPTYPVKYTSSYGVDATDGNQYFEITQIACVKGENCEGDLEPLVNEYDLARADHPAGDYGYSKFGPGKSYNAETRQELLHKHKRSASPTYPVKYTSSYGVDATDGNQYFEITQIACVKGENCEGDLEPLVNEYDLARADHPAGDYGYSKFGPGKSYAAETRQELLH